MKKILIPVDFSESSERAIAEGRILAEAFGSSVLLLHVVGVRLSAKGFGAVDPLPDWVDLISDNEKIEAEDKLQVYRESFGDMKERVETLLIHGAITDEIIKIINNTDVDFVIIGSNGIGSVISRAFLGSVANKVVHHSDKPVLVVR